MPSSGEDSSLLGLTTLELRSMIVRQKTVSRLSPALRTSQICARSLCESMAHGNHDSDSSGSPRPDMHRCSLVWENDTDLIIAWGNFVKIGRVTTDPGSHMRRVVIISESVLKNVYFPRPLTKLVSNSIYVDLRPTPRGLLAVSLHLKMTWSCWPTFQHVSKRRLSNQEQSQ
jgi:hypothetical protein